MLGSIQQKLRPVRLGLLVDPSRAGSIRDAIHINSTLWGGASNPLIPIYRRSLPHVWRESPLPTPNPATVAKGYVDAFDPDILVQCSPEVPHYVQNLGLPLIPASKIWELFEKEPDKREPKYGIGIFELLSQVYKEHFRYKERFPLRIIFPEIPRVNGLFWASLFGEIPKPLLAGVLKTYSAAIDLEKTHIETASVKHLFDRAVLFPRRITQYALNRFRRSSGLFDTCIFFMDEKEHLDIIDYWNLRALGRKVLSATKAPLRRSRNERLGGWLCQVGLHSLQCDNLQPCCVHEI